MVVGFEAFRRHWPKIFEAGSRLENRRFSWRGSFGISRAIFSVHGWLVDVIVVGRQSW